MLSDYLLRSLAPVSQSHVALNSLMHPYLSQIGLGLTQRIEVTEILNLPKRGIDLRHFLSFCNLLNFIILPSMFGLKYLLLKVMLPNMRSRINQR